MATTNYGGTGSSAGMGGPYVTNGQNMPIQPWPAAQAQGYYWDPVKSQYIKSPAAQGAAVNQFDNAASGGTLNSILSGLSGSGSSTGTGTSATSGTAGGSIPSFEGVGGTGSSYGSSGAGPINGGTPNPTLSMPDQSQVTTNAFNAAKDRAAQQSRASLSALDGELGAQGMLGGGAQVQGTKDIINDAGQYVSDVNRQASTTEAQTAADFAKTAYQGGITQRGQDMAQQTASRGQDVQYADAQSQLALAREQANRQYLSLILQGLSGGRSGASLY